MSATLLPSSSSLSSSAAGNTYAGNDATLFRSQETGVSFSQMLQTRINERPATLAQNQQPAPAPAPRPVEKPAQQSTSATTQREVAPSRPPETPPPQNTDAKTEQSDVPQENETAPVTKQNTASKEDTPVDETGSQTHPLSTDASQVMLETSPLLSALPVNIDQLKPAAETVSTQTALPAAIAALFSKLASTSSGQSTAEPPLTAELSDQLTQDGQLPALFDTALTTDNSQSKTLLLPRNPGATDDRTAKQPLQIDSATLQTATVTPVAFERIAAATTPALNAPDDNAVSSTQTALQGINALHGMRAQAMTPHLSTPQLSLNTPAGQSGWAEEVGNRVVWMLGRAESKAELVLTPPNLGKVEVSINLNGDQTTAQFIASTQAARDALEQALPRLREILQQSGIALGQTQVSTSDQQQASGGNHSSPEQQRHSSSLTGETDENSTISPPSSSWIKQSHGMVDTFV